jgi:DNA polymerase III alpha subunit
MVPQRNSDEKIVGIEMTDLEALGYVKFDVLGINLLDKIMKIEEFLDA